MMLKHRWFVWVALSVGCLFIGLSWAFNDYLFADVYGTFKGPVVNLRTQIAWEIVYWAVWAGLAPLIFWIAGRAPIEGKRWFRNLLINISTGGLLVIGHRVIYLAIAWLLYRAPFDSSESLLNLYHYLLLFNLPTGLMSYAAILLVSHMAGYYERFHEEELKASRLKAELAEVRLLVAQAQLQALKMQLQPHFLFNTLNSISALLSDDVEAADEMLARLGDFLRMTLDNSGAQEVSLQQELEFLRCYLEIERVRFQDRLSINLDIDPETLDARVPNLILQPIVENAIRHGVVRRLGPGRIEVRARRDRGSLQLQVTDNGPGLTQGQSGSLVREGLGLGNTRARLQQLYGSSSYSLSLTDAPESGLQVTLNLPYELTTEHKGVAVQ